MIDKISILCPTRERPELFKRMMNSISVTSVGSCEVLVYIDDDDPCIQEYRTVRHEFESLCKFYLGSSNGVGRAWNVLAKEATGSLLMLANDDLVFRTEGWDAKIIQAINDNGLNEQMFVAWADDGMPDSNKRCTFPIVPVEWLKAVGSLVPEIFHFLYHDTWIESVGQDLGRTLYMKHVMIEHCHFTFKKAAYDATYQRHRVGSENVRKRREDKAMFTKTKHLREQWAQMLREYTDEGD